MILAFESIQHWWHHVENQIDVSPIRMRQKKTNVSHKKRDNNFILVWFKSNSLIELFAWTFCSKFIRIMEMEKKQRECRAFMPDSYIKCEWNISTAELNLISQLSAANRSTLYNILFLRNAASDRCLFGIFNAIC